MIHFVTAGCGSILRVRAVRGLNLELIGLLNFKLSETCSQRSNFASSPAMSSEKKILCLFDVDGTLTKPRNKISKNLENILDKMKEKISLGLVSGSDRPKLIEQFGSEEALKRFEYVFPENGVVYYKNGQLISKESISKYMGEEKTQPFINFCLKYMSELKLPAKRGNFVEFRDSVINICPVGRSCSQQEREEFNKFDQEHNIRRTFVNTLEKEFKNSGFKFSIGGQISFDVFPKGWDKSFCLNHVVKDGFNEIHFFGDKTEEGGNDHEIFMDSRTIGHAVTNPEHTAEELTKLFLS